MDTNKGITEMTDDEIVKKIGQYIRSVRKQRKLNQTEAAEKVGITQSYYSLIERGEREPGISVYFRIADALEFDFGELWSYVRLRKPRVKRPTEEEIQERVNEERERRTREILLEIQELLAKDI